MPVIFTEESVDSNYDPSSFFTNIPVRKEDEIISKLQDDLAVSGSDEDEQKDFKTELQEPQTTTEEEVGSLWF